MDPTQANPLTGPATYSSKKKSKKSKKKSKNLPPPEIVNTVGEYDILLGRGVTASTAGNAHFQSLVLERKAEYTTLKTTKEDGQRKNQIAREIIHEITVNGGKFIKKQDVEMVPPGTLLYEVADEETVLEKTKQALRQTKKTPEEKKAASEAFKARKAAKTHAAVMNHYEEATNAIMMPPPPSQHPSLYNQQPMGMVMESAATQNNNYMPPLPPLDHEVAIGGGLGSLTAAAATHQPVAVQQQQQPPPKKKRRVISELYKNMSKEEYWEHMFLELSKFLADNNHCRVPNRYSPNQALGYWVGQQRTAYKQNKLDRNKIERLEHLGFEWNVGGTVEEKLRIWEDRFLELKAYREEHGNCLVPQRYAVNPKLGRWVMCQRMAYVKDKLRADRVNRLNELGFTWNAY
ncbi:predicted protein [Thalassiosira pseudonana CCMP1335]|uniref:Helicase-associated domain-containing protein n=1 Tax=Thalassiosira pseudonana TaxID=35128 RepID=B8CCR9_THAPS|nr:predicted protein [Thalassiosira pseudonana CCMP1335]EED88997.1 predicted protein [Thalassiosira pseudonana CCMP1335]